MKKATAVLLFLFSAIIILVVSCSKSSEDTLSQTPGNSCDTTNVTYSTDVVPILQAHCYSCHGNGTISGGVSLDSYEDVKQQAENGFLLGTITHASGYPPMPQDGPQLSDCNINIIRAWIDNGTPNN